MVQNRAFILKKTPVGMPIPGQDLTVESREFDLNSPPPAGGVMTKNIYASFDPYLRSCMTPANKSLHVGTFELGKPIVNFVVGEVIKSDSSEFPVGQFLVGFYAIEEYSFLTREQLSYRDAVRGIVKIPASGNLDIVNYLGALGMTGLTAYSSLYEIGKPKKGETIFISAASGAVGQLVGQLAQREGLRVIGSVGSDEKLDFILNELGFDGGFNYKKEKPLDALKRLAPEGIEIYYDNVGGEHLEAALENMKSLGRIIACGMISQYNKQEHEKYGIKNLILTVGKSLTIRGFMVSDPDLGPKYLEERNKNVTQWLNDGSLKVKTSVTEGIENAAHGFVAMMEGKNFGKAALRITER